MRVSLIFAIIISFMLFTVFPLIYEFISKISDSGFTWIHDFEENLAESVGPVLFSAQYLMCRHVQTDKRTHGQTDGLTDKLIWGGLGNLRFLQVNVVAG